MRQFETKLTLRIYDTKLIEKMNMIMKFNPNRYQSKNQLLLELLELGVREKLKEFPTPPTHTLVIGTTGSGKTTTFVNPAIQILAESKTKPSMLISDPKGELYQLHAKKLKKAGYKVQILDLRNPYNSVRWNPLERAYLNY